MLVEASDEPNVMLKSLVDSPVCFRIIDTHEKRLPKDNTLRGPIWLLKG